MQEITFSPNPGKNLNIQIEGVLYSRYPIKTHIITEKDDIFDVVQRYVAGYLAALDVVIISERAVATAQGRAYPIADIKPSWLARFLVKFVYKSPYGIGLGSPWTMELAIREAGVVRILIGAAAAAITKPFGLKGVFYKVVGHNVNAIDGPAEYVLPPFNKYAKLGPKDPMGVAQKLKSRFGAEFVIIDANDLGVVVLGSTDGVTEEFAKKAFKDNPLGQTKEQTPIAIVRKAVLC